MFGNLYHRMVSSPAQSSPNMEDYNTHGTVPGNPKAAELAMKQWYKFVLKYRSMHHGEYASSTNDIVSDIIKNFHSYGFNSSDEALASGHNPDSAYSTSKWDRDNFKTEIPYIVSNQRPDGTHFGAPTAYPGRDVLLYTDLYVHPNYAKVGTKSIMQAVGFYIVVWDNGSIQRIPYDRSLMMPAPNKRKAWTTVFPGQAGVSPDAIPYKKYYERYWRESF
jgi:hypothetical protein